LAGGIVGGGDEFVGWLGPLCFFPLLAIDERSKIGVLRIGVRQNTRCQSKPTSSTELDECVSSCAKENVRQNTRRQSEPTSSTELDERVISGAKENFRQNTSRQSEPTSSTELDWF
jgi:hypothetical protein